MNESEVKRSMWEQCMNNIHIMYTHPTFMHLSYYASSLVSAIEWHILGKTIEDAFGDESFILDYRRLAEFTKKLKTRRAPKAFVKSMVTLHRNPKFVEYMTGDFKWGEESKNAFLAFTENGGRNEIIESWFELR